MGIEFNWSEEDQRAGRLAPIGVSDTVELQVTDLDTLRDRAWFWERYSAL